MKGIKPLQEALGISRKANTNQFISGQHSKTMECQRPREILSKQPEKTHTLPLKKQQQKFYFTL